MKARGDGVSAAEVLQMCRDVAAALLFLQQQRVCHRDLKLSNVLWCAETSAAVLCDFGVAVRVDARGRCETGRNGPGGNLSHLAPEVLNAYSRQERAGGRIVLDYAKQPTFALGLLCFEIAVGQHPFGAHPCSGGRSVDVAVPALDVGALAEVGMPTAFGELLRAMVANDPRARVSLGEAYARLATIAPPRTPHAGRAPPGTHDLQHARHARRRARRG